MKNNDSKADQIQKFPCAIEPNFLERRINKHYKNRVQDMWGGRNILHSPQPSHDAIQLMSNDYLALAGHPKILRAQSEMLLNKVGGQLMSAVFLHDDSPQHKFERRLAHFMGAECGILCQSGWCANTGLIQSIADEQTPVYIDMLAHMSLWEGARCANAPAVMFHHNDIEHLERQILKQGQGVIVVDSVYSTNGSVCPLQDIAELSNNYGCVLVVDESHSLGTHGNYGEGMVASLGLGSKVHFRTASLAKAFAGRAGFITCSERFIDYFKFESNPAIFSSTLLPHEVAGLDATLTVIQSEGWRREQLSANAEYLRPRLDALGYNLSNSASQILSLEPGTEQQTIQLKEALEVRSVFGSIFCSPATPKNRAIIRFSLNCDLTMPELNRIIQVCTEIRDEVDLNRWASTRRKRNLAVATTAVSCANLQARELAFA